MEDRGVPNLPWNSVHRKPRGQTVRSAQAETTRQLRVADQLIGRRHAALRARERESRATGLMSVRPIGSSLEGAKPTERGGNTGRFHRGVGIVIAMLPSHQTAVSLVATVALCSAIEWHCKV